LCAAGALVALGMLQSSRSDPINGIVSKSVERCDEVPCNKAIEDLLNTFLGERNCEPYLRGIRCIRIRDCRKHAHLIACQQNGLVVNARHDLQYSLSVPELHKSLCMKLDHKLMNSLKGDAQSFSELTAPHRPIQQFEQPPGTGTRQCTVAPNSIRNYLGAAISSAPSWMPPIHLATSGKSQFLQFFERYCCLVEIKLGLYRNFSLGFFAISERDQTSRLGLGQNKPPSFGIHAGSPPDSARRQYAALRVNTQAPTATIHKAIRMIDLRTPT